MVPGIHDEPIGHEQEVELAALGLPGDLLDDRQVVVAGRRAVVAPSGGVIAGTEHEYAEVHLASLRGHGPLLSGLVVAPRRRRQPTACRPPVVRSQENAPTASSSAMSPALWSACPEVASVPRGRGRRTSRD